MKQSKNRIIECIKKEGLKGFFKRWKDGMMKIPPEKLLESEIIGYGGSILATILAGIVFLFVRNMWTISIIMFFTLIIQGSQLLAKYQQLENLKEMQRQMLGLNFEGGLRNESNN